MIKAILLDIDGTLTNSKKEITPRTMEALLRAQDLGIQLALVSARCENGLLRFAQQLHFEKHHGLLVSCNGARIKDMQTNEILYDKAMPLKTSTAILKHLEKFDVIPILAKEEYMYVKDVFDGMIQVRSADGTTQELNIIQYEARNNGYLLAEKKDLATFFSNYPLQKILVAGNPEYLKEQAEAIAEPFKSTTSHSFTAPFFYEFNPLGVNKAKAIHSAFKRLKITEEEMMAFGDHKNDIPMLSSVRYGIAMGNAIEEAKLAAYDTTLDNDHDGIAEALYTYIPELKKIQM